MFESLQKTWQETMEIPAARWIVWITVLIVAVLVAVYFVKMFRDMAMGNDSTSKAELLSDFERIRNEGKLDNEEFKRLKTSIRDQIDSENLKDEG